MAMPLLRAPALLRATAAAVIPPQVLFDMQKTHTQTSGSDAVLG